MPMLTKMVSAGDMVDMNRITLTEWSVKSSLAASKRCALEIGAHKGLDQARPGDVLLQDGVEPVQLLLHGAEERLHLDDEEDDDRRGDQQQRQHGQRQARARC